MLRQEAEAVVVGGRGHRRPTSSWRTSVPAPWPGSGSDTTTSPRAILTLSTRRSAATASAGLGVHALPVTVEDYVAANRARFDTDGRFAMTDARLRATGRYERGLKLAEENPCRSR